MFLKYFACISFLPSKKFPETTWVLEILQFGNLFQRIIISNYVIPKSFILCPSIKAILDIWSTKINTIFIEGHIRSIPNSNNLRTDVVSAFIKKKISQSESIIGLAAMLNIQIKWKSYKMLRKTEMWKANECRWRKQSVYTTWHGHLVQLS